MFDYVLIVSTLFSLKLAYSLKIGVTFFLLTLFGLCENVLVCHGRARVDNWSSVLGGGK